MHLSLPPAHMEGHALSSSRGRAHLSAQLHLLPSFAETCQVHLALAAGQNLLKPGDPDACHVVCLRLHAHLGLQCIRIALSSLQMLGLLISLSLRSA
jgi:hypothetical protein